MLDVTCFSEAERLYVLLKDVAVRGRLLTALVLPDLLVSEQWSWPFTHPRGGEREVRVFRCTGPTARLALFIWHLFVEFTGGSQVPPCLCLTTAGRTLLPVLQQRA